MILFPAVRENSKTKCYSLCETLRNSRSGDIQKHTEHTEKSSFPCSKQYICSGFILINQFLFLRLIMFNILFNWLLLNSAAFKESENMTHLGKMDGRLKVSVLCSFQAVMHIHRAFWGHQTDQRELIILQSRSSQHIRRLAWWSARTDGGTRMGSTSQFSSDSYKARIKSPTKCRLHCLYLYRKKKPIYKKKLQWQLNQHTTAPFFSFP